LAPPVAFAWSSSCILAKQSPLIATADPGTRPTPTPEDASLDQQLLDKSFSAQRILAERQAPASQTGKVSVDEPVGSSPAAIDPASARSVAGTPMAPPRRRG